MNLLPRHGVAYAVVLLAHVARISPRKGVDEWVAAARQHGSYLAAATDLRTPARALVAAGLASVGEEGSIGLAPPLEALAASSDSRRAMRHAAVTLLAAQPPAWLLVAVGSEGVEHAYIPQPDLDALSWLCEALDEVLAEARRLVGAREATDLAKEIGDAAEEIVVAALRAAGKEPVHVAQISDAYGYDVELPEEPVRFLEVKAVGPRTADRFHLSRNEFDTCVRRGDAWRIVQVVFDASAFVADPITAADVREIRELSAAAVRDLVPEDTPRFKWETSAILTPSASLWRPSALTPDPGFLRRGFDPRNVTGG
ncbi:DUF3883 domain-containing protein [Streptomyces sp. ID03-2B]|uniref:DUF3883 domain-containing protein n=1 Tax=Streptomyces sp. ID03-2B TaxID=3028660 RepID=UPI0029A9A120|nr:DUF3883 domain-containing protein [Streptomyces sp. ID03-2B]MDX3594818.1 DUF3883 domain-containing protein [Streptomyces sp. ID03-2B]